jgi:opacity protein-like surface antigen
MRKTILAVLLTAALTAPAAAASYPVSGKWGQTATSGRGAIDCSGKRVMSFNGNQRTDTGGGVPAYRNRSVTSDGPSQNRVVDEFTTGIISDAHTSYTLRKVDNDHIELQMEGGTVKLQRCK